MRGQPSFVVWASKSVDAHTGYWDAYDGSMTGRPGLHEAAPYYFTYIDQAPGDDPLSCMSSQLEHSMAMLRSITRSSPCTDMLPASGVSAKS